MHPDPHDAAAPRDAAALHDVAAPRGSWPAAAHLNPRAMAVAQRALVCKALAEFAHERLIAPQPQPDGSYRVATDGGRVTYRFRARRYALEHWLIDAPSLVREVAGRALAPDALDLVLELRDDLGIPESLLATYLEEVSATLAGAAYKHHHRGLGAGDLVHADFQVIEAAMTEGHPAFVANNARIGFGLSDHAAYAPEAGRPLRLEWLAVRREHPTLSCGRGVGEASLYEGQLGTPTLRRFAQRLRDVGLDPAAYLYLPAHPWQWEHKHAVTFAPDVARRAIVPLGTGPDRFQAQQSIRTFFDLDRPNRHYVKTALSIQNMGFVRGLSPGYMRVTPAINDWVADLVASDATLRACGFGILRELAAIGYTGDAFHRAGVHSPYQRMVAALWRESPVPRTGPGERLATMAALLHRDHAGQHFATALIAASGIAPERWLRRYLRAYLRPVVHCLLRYDLAFMPHGENVILVLDGHVPTRVFMKDIGEEVAVMNDDGLPEGIQRIGGAVDDDVMPLPVLTDVFDGFFRYLAAILDRDGVLAASRFWALVADCIRGHADDHPGLHDRVDLFAPEFRHSCLNRLQLRDTRQMVDISNQAGSLIFAGTLRNPIAR